MLQHREKILPYTFMDLSTNKDRQIPNFVSHLQHERCAIAMHTPSPISGTTIFAIVSTAPHPTSNLGVRIFLEEKLCG